MTRLLVALVALIAAPALAQIGPLPNETIIGIPIFAEAGSLDFGASLTASGVSSPTLGFLSISTRDFLSASSYAIADVSGGVSLLACAILPCSDLPEQNNGVDTGEEWIFLDGLFIPRLDGGALIMTPVGGIGGGVHLSTSGVAKDGESLGWVDYGIQGAYGASIGPVAVVATGTYAWGFEGGSQAVTGRAVKLRADLFMPRDGIDLIGFIAVDRRTDTMGTEVETDNYRGAFVTFGAGVGF